MFLPYTKPSIRGFKMGMPLCSNSKTSKLYPDEEKYGLLSITEIGKFVIVEVKYYGCINYDGRKLLVYKGITKDTIKNATKLNPHFLEQEGIFPFARFEPTTAGEVAAVSLVILLNNMAASETEKSLENENNPKM